MSKHCSSTYEVVLFFSCYLRCEVSGCCAQCAVTLRGDISAVALLELDYDASGQSVTVLWTAVMLLYGDTGDVAGRGAASRVVLFI